jgi:AcrR family transcriptional regulator
MSSKNIDTRTKILEAAWRLMEERHGRDVRMSDIAQVAGISRQALYLHFESRTDLLVATTHYVDKVRGLSKRLEPWKAARTGIESLEAYVEFLGNYIPEIYGLGKALMAVYHTDEAAAAAWNDRMNAVRNGCRDTVDALIRDGMLAEGWTREEAIDLFWTLVSVRNWEHLTRDCGWPVSKYISAMQEILKKTIVRKP